MWLSRVPVLEIQYNCLDTERNLAQTPTRRNYSSYPQMLKFLQRYHENGKVQRARVRFSCRKISSEEKTANALRSSSQYYGDSGWNLVDPDDGQWCIEYSHPGSIRTQIDIRKIAKCRNADVWKNIYKSRKISKTTKKALKNKLYVNMV